LKNVVRDSTELAEVCLRFYVLCFFVPCYTFTARSFSLTVSGQLLDKGFDMVNEFLSFIEPADNIFGFETDKVGSRRC